MAISSGAGPHLAWITINGQPFPLEEGSVQRAATRKSGTFSGRIPLWFMPEFESILANLGDNTAVVYVQTRGQTTTLITGEVDMVEMDYIGGMAHISGRDVSAKLHAVKSAEKWLNKKPHEIIQDLAGRAGIQTNIDQSTIYAGRYVSTDWAKLTDGVSYAAVIHKMTELMGAHWYVDKQGTLNVKSTQSSAAPYIINFSHLTGTQSDALALRVCRNVQAGKPVKVTVNSWHEHEKKAYVGTYTVGGNGTTQNYAYHLPGFDQDHVNQHAKSKAQDHSRHEITVQVECVGDPSITIDQPLQLNGTAFAQTLTIDSIDDSFGMRGHKMRISAKSATKQGTAASGNTSNEGFDGP